MKRFQFSLQSVLTLRQRREQAALEHYGRAVGARQQAVETLRVARAEWETIDQARQEIADYIERYHHRPHSGLGYRTPHEVAASWRGTEDLQTRAT